MSLIYQLSQTVFNCCQTVSTSTWAGKHGGYNLFEFVLFYNLVYQVIFYFRIISFSYSLYIYTLTLSIKLKKQKKSYNTNTI